MSETGHDGRLRHPTPLPAITIGDYLAAVAARGPRPGEDRGKGGAPLTYAELALDVERVACGLLALGIEKGDRIASWAPHSTEWTLIQLAAARAGAVLVILDGEWSTDQLDAALRQANPRLLAAGGPERLASLQAARGELSHDGRLVALDGLPCASRDGLTWAELLVAGSAIDPARLAEREATLDPDDPASIEYEQLPGGELQTTTLTHRDYLGGNAHDLVKEQDQRTREIVLERQRRESCG
jgi:fatty-acyl-CoA synthase